MPARSKAQMRMMEGAAHSVEFAKKVGVPMGVAKEFVGATQRVKGLPERKGPKATPTPSPHPKPRKGGGVHYASHDHADTSAALGRVGIKRRS